MLIESPSLLWGNNGMTGIKETTDKSDRLIKYTLLTIGTLVQFNVIYFN